MADTERLQSMLDNIINDRGEESQIDFHAYLQDKMKEVMYPNFNDDDEEKNEE